VVATSEISDAGASHARREGDLMLAMPNLPLVEPAAEEVPAGIEPSTGILPACAPSSGRIRYVG
jgi:hypothetical protein